MDGFLDCRGCVFASLSVCSRRGFETSPFAHALDYVAPPLHEIPLLEKRKQLDNNAFNYAAPPLHEILLMVKVSNLIDMHSIMQRPPCMRLFLLFGEREQLDNNAFNQRPLA